MDPQRSTSFPPGGSPKLQWGSPALRPMASFPPRIGNRMTAVPNMMNTPPHRPPMPMGGMTFGSGSPQFARAPRSPQFARAPYPQPFRTPQPRQHSPSTPRHHWSADNRGNNKPRFPFQKNQSLFGSPNHSVNPGGSNDITQYYHPAMVSDPWKHVPPLPVDHWLNQ